MARDLPAEPSRGTGIGRTPGGRHRFAGPRRRSRLPRVPTSVDTARYWRLVAVCVMLLMVTLAVANAVAVSSGWWCPPCQGQERVVVPPDDGVTEDDPRWDCRTMGNRQCGPTDQHEHDI